MGKERNAYKILGRVRKRGCYGDKDIGSCCSGMGFRMVTSEGLLWSWQRTFRPHKIGVLCWARVLELEFILQSTVSRPVCLGIRPPFGTLDQILSCSSFVSHVGDSPHIMIIVFMRVNHFIYTMYNIYTIYTHLLTQCWLRLWLWLSRSKSKSKSKSHYDRHMSRPVRVRPVHSFYRFRTDPLKTTLVTS
jgi:hypothetical protein